MYLGTRIHDGNLSGGRCTHLAVLRSHCFTAGDFLVHQILSVVVALLLLVAGWFHYHVLAGLGSLASPDFNLRNLFTLNWEASDVGICVPRNGWALMVL